MRKQKKKISFVFEVFLLIAAMIAGIVMLIANGFNPFMGQYVFIGIIVLEAFCLAMLIAIGIIVKKVNKRIKEEDDEY